MRGYRLFPTVLKGLAIFAVSAQTFAATSLPSGWLIEGNLGSTSQSNTSYPNFTSTSQSGIGTNVNIAYKFMPYFALEGGYTAYAKTDIFVPSLSAKAAQDKFYAYDIAGKGVVPIVDSGVELFAKAGIVFLNSKITVQDSFAASAVGISNSKDNATGLYLAAGGQYYFTQAMALVAQWARAEGNSNTSDQTLVSGGISYIFG